MFSVGDLTALEDMVYSRIEELVLLKNKSAMESYQKAFVEVKEAFEVDVGTMSLVVFNMNQDYCKDLVELGLIDPGKSMFYQAFYAKKN